MFRLCNRAIHISQSCTPHKLILIYTRHKSPITEALAQRVRKELRAVYLNALETDKIVQSPQVPYTVVITDRALVDGVLHLRHFHPRITEEVHVSQLTDKLLQQANIR